MNMTKDSYDMLDKSNGSSGLTSSRLKILHRMQKILPNDYKKSKYDNSLAFCCIQKTKNPRAKIRMDLDSKRAFSYNIDICERVIQYMLVTNIEHARKVIDIILDWYDKKRRDILRL